MVVGAEARRDNTGVTTSIDNHAARRLMIARRYAAPADGNTCIARARFASRQFAYYGATPSREEFRSEMQDLRSFVDELRWTIGPLHRHYPDDLVRPVGTTRAPLRRLPGARPSRSRDHCHPTARCCALIALRPNAAGAPEPRTCSVTRYTTDPLKLP
jgi:hypothetical protein